MRSRVRDYYDLWKILTEYSKELNFSSIPYIAKEKCIFKEVVFKDRVLMELREILTALFDDFRY